MPQILQPLDTGVRVIGECFQTYIIAEDKEGLILIDKHAAHERLLYEKLKRREEAAMAQTLLVPVTVTMDKNEYTAVLQNLSVFEQAGFDVEDFGSGTVLDSSRFRTLLGYHLGVSPKSIHGYVLGEHGDSEVLIWSSANAGGVQIEEFAEKIGKPFTPELKAKIDDCVRNAAYQIIDGKGSTYYGIAGALCRICQAISANEYAILTLSTFHEKVENSENICISYPCIVGKRGIQGEIYPDFSESEHRDLALSASIVEGFTKDALHYIQENK